MPVSTGRISSQEPADICCLEQHGRHREEFSGCYGNPLPIGPDPLPVPIELSLKALWGPEGSSWSLRLSSSSLPFMRSHRAWALSILRTRMLSICMRLLVGRDEPRGLDAALHRYPSGACVDCRASRLFVGSVGCNSSAVKGPCSRTQLSQRATRPPTTPWLVRLGL